MSCITDTVAAAFIAADATAAAPVAAAPAAAATTTVVCSNEAKPYTRPIQINVHTRLVQVGSSFVHIRWSLVAVYLFIMCS